MKPTLPILAAMAFLAVFSHAEDLTYWSILSRLPAEHELHVGFAASHFHNAPFLAVADSIQVVGETSPRQCQLHEYADNAFRLTLADGQDYTIAAEKVAAVQLARTPNRWPTPAETFKGIPTRQKNGDHIADQTPGVEIRYQAANPRIKVLFYYPDIKTDADREAAVATVNRLLANLMPEWPQARSALVEIANRTEVITSIPYRQYMISVSSVTVQAVLLEFTPFQ